MSHYEKAYLRTPLGLAEILGDDNGIASVSVSADRNEPVGRIPPCLFDCHKQLREYFDGTRQEFSLMLNPEGTEFQKRVWKELRSIPFGSTVSYLELARRLGDEKAIRAVAAANARNPLWILIPCHRVIGSDGSLTGYAGVIWRKKWLLDHECPPLQTSLF